MHKNLADDHNKKSSQSHVMAVKEVKDILCGVADSMQFLASSGTAAISNGREMAKVMTFSGLDKVGHIAD